MSSLSEENRPKFNNPPVVEVSATAQFSDLEPSTLMLGISEIWQKIGKTAYPEILIKNKRGRLSHEVKELRFEFMSSEDDFVCPRYWFVSSDKSFVVQIQTDRISVNWRKTEESKDADYSSYEAVWERFAGVMLVMSAFSEEQLGCTLDINFMELSYTNIIPFRDFGGAAEIDKCIPSITSKYIPDYLGKADAVNFLWDTAIDGGISKFRVQGLTALDNKTGENLLRLDYSQRGAVDLAFDKETDKIHNWFNEAHLRIVNAFKDMGSDYMKANVWGIRDE